MILVVESLNQPTKYFGMKKIILMAALLLGAPIAMISLSSCNTLNQVHTVGKTMNVANTAQEIASVLTGTLGLNSSQTSSLVGIFSGYIVGTNDISDLIQGGSKSKYLKQLNGLNADALGQIKEVLNPNQFSTLLGLAGKKSGPSALINGLTGGENLSGGAKQVLQGLLLNQAAKSLVSGL